MKRIALLVMIFAAGCGGRVGVSSSTTGVDPADAGSGSGGTAGAAGAGAGGQAGAAGSGDPIEAACASYAELGCQQMAACYSEDYFHGVFGDEEGCRSLNKKGCRAQYFQDGSTFTPADLQACIAASAQLPACAGLSVACNPTPGTRENGAACGVHAQCKSGACCSEQYACGTCCDLPKQGEPCAGDRCADGLACRNPFSTISMCLPLIQEGGDCAEPSLCTDFHACVNDVCKPSYPGDACTSEYDCSGALTCDTAAGVCIWSFTVTAAEGEACAGWVPTQMCQRGLACKYEDAGKVCVAGAKLGEPCTADSQQYYGGSNCGLPLSCIGGKCVEPMPAICP